MIYGYARVSTKEQNEDRQIIALKNYGIAAENIFTDKESGKDFNRKYYKKLFRKLKKDDVLVVKSIDRLGRNYNDILEQWQNITKKIKADIIVLDMPILDTTKHKDLIGTLISDIVLQLLSYVAENERANIKQRQAEGIAAAKARGVKFGRKQKYSHLNYTKIFDKYMKKQIRLKECLKEIGCCERTFYTMYNEYIKSEERIE